MSKINKYANLYDKDGNLIRKAPLTNYTIEEVEKLIDEYTGDKDSAEYMNLFNYLMQLYQKYGNPHEKELLETIKLAQQKQNETTTNNSNDDGSGILGNDEELPTENIENEAAEPDNVPSYNTDTNASEYVEYEPITE